jgi:ribonuclease-3
MAVRDPLVAAVHGHPLTETPARAATPTLHRAQLILGHEFTSLALLAEALTHRSAARQTQGARKGAGSNERLEFVGDRVLGLLVAEWLAERFPREQEGELGIRLAHLVSQPVLAAVAEEIALPEALNVSDGEARAGVRRRATVLADAMEAAIGAMYLDGGIEPARRFVRRAWDAVMNAQSEPPKDSKTALQEWAQGRGLPLPDYQIVSREGPPHAPVFVISVTVDGRTGTGTGGNKRMAEQAAALDLLGQLET